MTNQARDDDARSPEREDAPEGRDTPVVGGQGGKKVKPLAGEAEIERKYDPGVPERESDPWQDPGGPEPHNG